MIAVRGVGRTVVAWEMRSAARTRWLLGAALVYGVGAVALTLVGLRSLRDLGVGGTGAAIDGILAMGVLLPPLMGLLAGASSIAGAREQGTLAVLAAQPIRRRTIPLSTITGLTLTIWAAIGIGLGLTAVILSPVASGGELVGLAVAAGASLAAAAVGVAIGVAVSAIASTRSQATAVAAAIWFTTALGFDLVLAAVGPAIRLGPVGFLWSVLVNPLESIRLLAFSIIDPGALGPFGVYMADTFGTAGTIGILAGAVVFWVVTPAMMAVWAIQRRDV